MISNIEEYNGNDNNEIMKWIMIMKRSMTCGKWWRNIINDNDNNEKCNIIIINENNDNEKWRIMILIILMNDNGNDNVIND